MVEQAPESYTCLLEGRKGTLQPYKVEVKGELLSIISKKSGNVMQIIDLSEVIVRSMPKQANMTHNCNSCQKTDVST